MNDPELVAKIKQLLHMGDETLGSAKALLEQDYYRDAVSRAYYAAFHSVQAVLLYHGKVFSSHKAVHSSFNRDVIHAGLLPKELGPKFSILFEHRQIGDYRTRPEITREQAVNDVENARKIIQEVKRWLANNVSDFQTSGDNSS